MKKNSEKRSNPANSPLTRSDGDRSSDFSEPHGDAFWDAFPEDDEPGYLPDEHDFWIEPD